MRSPLGILLLALIPLALAPFLFSDQSPPEKNSPLRAGAHIEDITPPFDSLLINGGFTERRVGKMNPGDLKARCFVLERDQTTIAIAVVDSCMIPREVCDEAKKIVAQKTGIATDHILITSTHTHTAPSTMDYCLGTMADPAYTAFLPPKIAAGIISAHAKLQPARIGWTQIPAKGFTHNRRWITRPDKMQKDPFGETTVRAMMHPGYQNPNYIGPSGPVDDDLSLISIETLDGKPLGLLANFAMHYYGNCGPSDYFGIYADRLAKKLTRDDHTPVCAMTQGTSGDLYWVDYEIPHNKRDASKYTNDLIALTQAALKNLPHHESPPLAMAQKSLTLKRRLPDQKRLAWADQLLLEMKDRRPKNRPEVYAEQARYLHQNPSEEILLQTLRIGDLALTALPNEVYALTGLKLKARSPFQTTINLELSNGASGYIPPPEQHALGGYNTWPARTAGLEIQAEPKIVESLLASLESLAGKPRRQAPLHHGDYPKAILAKKPLAYWRCDDLDGSLRDSSPHNRPGKISGTAAYYLDGPNSPAFSGPHSNHALQLVGGSVSATIPDARSLTFWLWNGMDQNVRDNTGDLVLLKDSLHLRLGGKADLENAGHLILQSENQTAHGKTPLTLRHWHHLALSIDDTQVHLYLDGNPTPELSLPRPKNLSNNWHLGGKVPLEGRFDEVAWFANPLTGTEAQALHAISKITPPPKPLDPKAALDSIKVPDGFTVSLVAAEPLIQDPVAIDWGPDGKLWVAEMADYPLGSPDKSGGRIRFLEDLDQDGSYEKSTLFLDGLKFPTSIMPWKKGVLITSAPDIIYAEDSNGDGQADIQKALFTGFTQHNQQLRLNSLRPGLDHWIYGASGAHHRGFATDTVITSPVSKKTFPLGNRDFRIDPDRGLLEPVSGPSQFGRTRDDWGNWFGLQNSYPAWHYLHQHHYLTRNPHLSPPDPRRFLTKANPRVFPATPSQKRFHSFHHTGRYTSACSPNIYRDSFLFDDENTHLFTCEPVHNLVQHNLLKPRGPSFILERANPEAPLDFFTSTDRWCRPVMTRTGPDGTLWVVDMYRYVIEHLDWLPKSAQAEMAPLSRLGVGQGRIYRIVPTTKKSRPILHLANATPKELLTHLSHKNGPIRDQAQRLLSEKKDPAIAPHLLSIVKTSQNPDHLHALHLLEKLNLLTPKILATSLKNKNPQIRRHALRLAEPRLDDKNLLKQAAQLASDQNPVVQLQAAYSLGNSPSKTAAKALAHLAQNHANDPDIRLALLTSAHLHFDTLAQAALKNPALLADLLKVAPQKSALDSLITQLAQPGPHGYQPAQFKNLATLLDQKPNSLASLTEPIQKARTLLANPKSPLPLRVAATQLLARQPAHLAADKAQLASLLTNQTPPALKLAALNTVARLGQKDLPITLLTHWSQHLPNERFQIIDILLRRPDWTRVLLDALAQKTIARTDLDASRQQLLLTHSDPALRQLATDILKPKPRKQLQTYRPALTLPGDPKKGRPIFQNLCATCHLPAEGQPANGPDLRALTDRSKEGLFNAILDPNQSVDPSYVSYLLTLKNGTTHFGRILSQDNTAVTLRTLDGTDHTLPRPQIKSLKNTNLSLMPEGLETTLTPRDLANLIRFLQTHKDSR